MGWIVFNLLAKSLDIRSEILWFIAVFWPPNRSQNLRVCYRDILVLHQQGQQFKLLGIETDFFPCLPQRAML